MSEQMDVNPLSIPESTELDSFYADLAEWRHDRTPRSSVLARGGSRYYRERTRRGDIALPA